MDTPTPLTLCQEYAHGTLSRADLVTALAVYDYAPAGHTTGEFAGDVVDSPGPWAGVVVALLRGLIDTTIYEDVLQARRRSLREPG